jgi:hypothetical protein
LTQTAKEGMGDMSDVISRKELLEWLDIEIDLSKGNNPVLKADRWAFEQIKKAIETGRFDIERD